MVSITFLKTPDGAKLALYHYEGIGNVRYKEPVFMISGFGLNRIALDLNDRFSWARGLAQSGHDTWILEVRGSGRSKLAGTSDGSFDDYLKDAVQAVNHVLKVSKSEKLHWVGYSLGGMLLYAYLSSHGNSKIRSGITIESPLHLRDYPISEKEKKILQWFKSSKLPIKKTIPYKALGRMFIPLAPLFYKSPMFTRWMNADNIEKKLLPGIIYKTFDNVPVALALQFSSWNNSDGFSCVEGKIDYLENLKNADVPILIMTGVGDFAERARGTKEILGEKAQHIEFLKSHGFSADYGHADFIFGKRAPEEVMPHLAKWISRHSLETNGSSSAIT